MRKKIASIIILTVLIFTGCHTSVENSPSENISNQVMSVIEENASSDDKNTVLPDVVTDIIKEKTPEEIRAQEILDSMTLEEKLGQMFFVRHRQETAENLISSYNIGGFLMFGSDFETSNPDSFKQMVDAYQKQSKISLLIGVDEEGGNVVRASKYTQFRNSPFKSPRQLYAEGGMKSLIEDAKEKSVFLKNLGINVNLAPVCDISTDSGSFMYSRSIGLDADETALYVINVQNAMAEEKMGSIIKHFPGYGDNDDTHWQSATDNRTLEYLSQNDLLPFAAAIKNGCDAILVSHNIVTAIDDSYPATLSAEVHNYLKNELDFDGIIVTDDLDMKALEAYTPQEAAILAVQAGNDIIITGNIIEQYDALLESLKSGEIGDNRIDESVYKILLWKIKLGIIE